MVKGPFTKSPAKTTGLSIDISKQREQYTAINWYYIIVIYQEWNSLQAIYYSEIQLSNVYPSDPDLLYLK